MCVCKVQCTRADCIYDHLIQTSLLSVAEICQKAAKCLRSTKALIYSLTFTVGLVNSLLLDIFCVNVMGTFVLKDLLYYYTFLENI